MVGVYTISPWTHPPAAAPSRLRNVSAKLAQGCSKNLLPCIVKTGLKCKFEDEDLRMSTVHPVFLSIIDVEHGCS